MSHNTHKTLVQFSQLKGCATAKIELIWSTAEKIEYRSSRDASWVLHKQSTGNLYRNTDYYFVLVLSDWPFRNMSGPLARKVPATRSVTTGSKHNSIPYSTVHYRPSDAKGLQKKRWLKIMLQLPKQVKQAVRHKIGPITIVVTVDLMFCTNVMLTNFLYLNSDSEGKEKGMRATMYIKLQLFHVNFCSVSLSINSGRHMFNTLVHT